MSKAFPIKDFPEYYITDAGDVFSRQTMNNPNGRIRKLKLTKDRFGYLRVCLSDTNHKKHILLIHRLVAQTFIPNPDNKPCVNHIDGNKENNIISNLEWCSYSENNTHAYRVLGKDSTRAIIVQQIKDGKVIAEYYGAREASRKTGIGIRSIYQCCSGRSKSGHGFQWCYKNC